MQFWRSGRRVLWGAVLGLSAGGCTGGQSGSEAPAGSQACLDKVISLRPDEKPPANQSGAHASPNELLAKFAPKSIDGVWLRTEAHHTLTVEISHTATAGTYAPCRQQYLIDTTATIRTDDGVIDLTTPVQVSAMEAVAIASFSIALPVLPSEVLGDPLWAADVTRARDAVGGVESQVGPDAPSPSLTVELYFDRGPPGSRAEVIQDQRLVGAWADEGLGLTGPPTAYTPPPELTSSCVGAEQFQGLGPDAAYTPYSSSEAALAADVGAWVRCADNTAYERAGVEILPDGSWRDLAVEGGGFVALTGFDHEGIVYVAATEGGDPGLFFLDFIGGGAAASDRALVFSAPTPDWPSAVYLPTTLPVRTNPSPYVDGERAGAAACDAVEQGILLTFAEGAAALEGTFALCSGNLGAGVTGLRFTGGAIEFLGAGGAVLQAPTYELDTMNSPNVSLRLGDGRYWMISVSRFPRKLSIEEGAVPPAVILSAMP